jgi:hypothetical protein
MLVRAYTFYFLCFQLVYSYSNVINIILRGKKEKTLYIKRIQFFFKVRPKHFYENETVKDTSHYPKKENRYFIGSTSYCM